MAYLKIKSLDAVHACWSCGVEEKVSSRFHNRAGTHHSGYCAVCLREKGARYRQERQSEESKKQRAQWTRDWRAKLTKDERSRINRQSNLRKNYGIGIGDYDSMFNAQRGVCAICGTPPPSGKNLLVDHCHNSGEVRGLLCSPCNFAIGLFEDDAVRMARAINYVSSRKARVA